MESAELAHRFQFHPADAQNTRDAHEKVRRVLLDAANEVVDLIPDGRELALFLTKLEEAQFWANAGIARGDGPRT